MSEAGTGDRIESKKDRLARLLRERAEQAKVWHPVSNGQRALWFMHQLSPLSAANNEAFAWRVQGAGVNTQDGSYFDQLVERHPILRTTYVAREGVPWAVVHPRIRFPLEWTDAQRWSEADLEQALAQESNRPFDLEKGPLLRLHAFRREDVTIVLMVMHHIAIDLSSMAIIIEELQALMLAHAMGGTAALPPVSASYKDFVEWEAAMIASPEGDRQRNYWLKRLAGPRPLLELPYDRPRPPVQTFRGRTHPFGLSARLTQQLEDLAREQRTTLHTLLLATYQVFLHRYTGQNDILVGSVASGRNQARFERVVGYLANPVVMRAQFDGDPSFREFLAQAWQSVQEMLEHQNYPFSLLVERLLVRRDPSRGPLVDTVFVLQRPQRERSAEERRAQAGSSTFGVAERDQSGTRMSMGGSLLELFLVEHHIAKFDLELEMFGVGDRLSGWFRYNTDIFDCETIARMSNNFLTLLQGVVEHPEARLSELPLLSPEERHDVLDVSAPRQTLRSPAQHPDRPATHRRSQPSLLQS
jgi:hypothetical protein